MALIEKLENIGDAIRSKTGKTDLLTLDEMVTEIGNIETGLGSGGDVSEYFNTEINENTSSSKSFMGMSVKKMPDLTIGSNVTSMSYAFSGFLGTNIPNLTILSTKIKDFSYMFYNCKNITSVPSLDTSNGTSFNQMFYGCSSLKTIPLINTSNGTNFTGMFLSCSSLTEVPLLDTSKGSNFTSLFNGCSSLIEVPSINTSSGSTLEYTFQNCSSLTTIPELNFSKVKNINSNAFSNCSKLTILGGFFNLGQSCTYKSSNNSNYILNLSASTLLTHESLMNVINKLYDLNLTYDVANGGTLYTQKLVLGSTNTAKLTAEEIAIATNKGWTVS